MCMCRIMQLLRHGGTSLLRHSTIVTRRVNCSTSVTCWKCTQNLSIPLDKNDDILKMYFCGCLNNVILPPVTHDYFTLLGVLKSYEVDQQALTQNYRRLQSFLHPDKFANKSEVEQSLSSQQSTLINKAYSTLARPYSRALYLIEQEGLSISEEDTGVGDNPTFLMEIMELNEKLATSPSTDTLLQMKKENENQLSKCEKELIFNFRSENYQLAKQTLGKMKYYQNIQDNIEDQLLLV